MPEEHGSWLQFLHRIQVGGHPLIPSWVPESVPLAAFCALILVLLAALGTRRMRSTPSGLQTVMETAVSGLTGFTQGVLGERKGAYFAPLIGTFFLYILLMNLLGMIPGFKSPTADLNTTVALALVVFLSAIYFGMRSRGVIGYFRHMIADVLDLPGPLKIFLVPLMLVLETISVLVRPLSLSMRLFGNIMGKEVVLTILFGLGTVTLAIFGLHVAGFEILGTHVNLNVPVVFGPVTLLIAACLLPLDILMAVIQALVFSLLACLYLLLDTGTGEPEAQHVA